jgi:hypothetical protein
MITKPQRQSSRKATDIHRQFGRTGRAYKRDSTQAPTKAIGTKKKSLWRTFVEWVKSLFGYRREIGE